jgi:eukaryotic-like serine/threonine-protein kinase
MEILGQGGMARVFRAELVGSGGFRKQCALKVIHRSIVGEDPSVRQLLLNEARLGGLLKHPNIVDTYDCGEIDGQPYIAMELIRGLGLDQLVADEGALPPPIVMGIAVQMCAALDHAHDLQEAGQPANLVHRDLKPSNAMLSRDGLLKLMDFGIAKANIVSGATTKTGMTKGTPQYMSPEQISGKALDQRSDIFAFGAILFELFTGDRLFRAENIGGIVLKIVTADDALERDERLIGLSQLSAGLEAVVRRCVRVAPADRFPNALALRSELKGLGLPIADSEDLKAWVRDRMEDPSTTTADVPSVVGPTPRSEASFADTTPLPMPAHPETLPDSMSRQPVGPTRPMAARTGGRRAPVVAALISLVLLVAVVGWVVWGRDTSGFDPDDEGTLGGEGRPVPERHVEASEDPGSAVVEAQVGLAPDVRSVPMPAPEIAPTPAPEIASTPGPAPAPVETPTPAPVAVAEPVSEPTPAAVETPEPTPSIAAPPTLSLAEKSLPDTALRLGAATFEVIVEGSPDTSAALWYRLPGEGSWRNLQLTPGGDGAMVGELRMERKWGGETIPYYIVARDLEDQTERLGSQTSPMSLRVR